MTKEAKISKLEAILKNAKQVYRNDYHTSKGFSFTVHPAWEDTENDIMFNDINEASDIIIECASLNPEVAAQDIKGNIMKECKEKDIEPTKPFTIRFQTS
jgi:hypothetical protein